MKRSVSDFLPVLSRVRHEGVFLLIFHKEIIMKIYCRERVFWLSLKKKVCLGYF